MRLACALERVIAICFAENLGSWRIMEKAGMYVADRENWGS